MKIQRKAVRAEVPSTAMGDIAFNLLIFFVILARANDDSFLNWQPARAKNLEAAGYAKVSVLIDAEQQAVPERPPGGHGAVVGSRSANCWATLRPGSGPCC